MDLLGKGWEHLTSKLMLARIQGRGKIRNIPVRSWYTCPHQGLSVPQVKVINICDWNTQAYQRYIPWPCSAAEPWYQYQALLGNFCFNLRMHELQASFETMTPILTQVLPILAQKGNSRSCVIKSHVTLLKWVAGLQAFPSLNCCGKSDLVSEQLICTF